MSAVLEFAVGLESILCGECGMTFAVPAHWLQKRREGEGGNKSFCCPAGHSRVFSESEADRLRREIAAKQKDLDWQKQLLESARKSRDHAEAQARALRGVVTRVKRRVGHGTCPCCNRTFRQLARHMAAKHPDYAKPESET